jgi:hypothetical protein
MTKYILNSGGIRNASDKGKQFFSEVLKGLGLAPKILICDFAQQRERWEGKLAEDKENMKTIFAGEVSPVLSLAFPETFEEQVKNCDVIYIHGGDDHLIAYWLKQFDVPKIWEGKVVATSSAGSHVLSQSFWTCDWRKPLPGLGILPVRFIAHFKSNYGASDPRGPIDWNEAYAQLEKYGDITLPIIALREGEFVVFEA